MRHRWQRWLLVEWDDTQARAWLIGGSSVSRQVVAYTTRETGVDPASALRACADALHGRRFPLVSILPGTEAIVRQISLPPQISEETLDAIMEHELPRHLPMSPNAFACDYHIVRAGIAQTSVLLTAVRRNVLDQHLEVLMRAGLKPSKVLPSTVAFAFSAPPHSGHWCAIQAREHLTDIVLFQDGAVIQARSFDPRKTEPVREIAHTLQAYLKQQCLEVLEYGLYLSTGGELPQALGSQLARHWQVAEEPHPLFAGARVIPLDLRRQLLWEDRDERRNVRRCRWLGLMPVALTILLLVAFLSLRGLVGDYETRAEAREQQRFQVQQQRDSIRGLERQVVRLQDQRQTFRWLEEQYPSLAQRLRELVVRLPETIWLEGISTPEEGPSRRKRLERPLPTCTLIITGYAPDQPDIDAFVQNLASATPFDVVTQEASEPKHVGGNRWLRFKLSLRSHTLEGEER